MVAVLILKHFTYKVVDVKVKAKVHLHSESPLQKRSGMARVLKYLTVLPAHPHVHPQSE